MSDFKSSLSNLKGISDKNVDAVIKKFPTSAELCAHVHNKEKMPFSRTVNKSLLAFAKKQIELKIEDTHKTENEESSSEKVIETLKVEQNSTEKEQQDIIENADQPDIIEDEESSSEEEIPDVEVNGVVVGPSLDEEEDIENVKKIDTNPMMIHNLASFNLRFEKGAEVYILHHRAVIPVSAIPRWVFTHPEYKNLRRDKQVMFKPLKSNK